MTFTRRSLLKSTLVAGAAISMPAYSYGRVLGSNARLRCGVIGVKGRGQDHIRGLGENVVAYCDCDESILGQRAQDKKVKTFKDYRKLLEDKNIDAVSIATPNHQHSIMGIRALMAGKHVYVEKPVSHNVWEGRQLANAQSKYDRVVQCGTQSRSSPSLQEAVAYVRDGSLERSSTRPEPVTNRARALANSTSHSRSQNTSTMTCGADRLKSVLYFDQDFTTIGTGISILATVTWEIRESIKWISRAGFSATTRSRRA